MVALGGGRVIDAAKAIAGADGLRCAAIPTTLAGSSFTPFHRMPTGVEDATFVRPALAVCDPALMASAPTPGLAATAMNALAHAVESLYAPGANPVAEGAALRSTALFARGLPADPPVAEDLALAAVLAGWAVGTTGLAVHHALCQTIVRGVGVPHAQTNAVMLPHTVAFMADRAPGAVAALAGALEAAGGEPAVSAGGERALPADEGSAAAAAKVAELAALAGPRTLAELGVAEAQIPRVASAAVTHPGMGGTPGGVTEQDLRRLLARAL
jgi:maleylacetate reductase